jgi:hypothetical protein
MTSRNQPLSGLVRARRIQATVMSCMSRSSSGHMPESASTDDPKGLSRSRPPARTRFSSQTRRGRFHEGGSLAGNDASEFSSTMSRDSDRFKAQRLEHRKSAAAAATNANPTTYVRRRVSAMRISFDISCSIRERLSRTRYRLDI